MRAMCYVMCVRDTSSSAPSYFDINFINVSNSASGRGMGRRNKGGGGGGWIDLEKGMEVGWHFQKKFSG